MKRKIFTILIVLISISSYSQIKNYEVIKDKSIYLYPKIETNDKISLYFFSNNETDMEPLSNKDNIGLKKGYTNIYIKWLNPLKYEISWKDSIIIDSRDKNISSFINLLTAQFGNDITNLNKEDSTNIRKAIENNNTKINEGSAISNDNPPLFKEFKNGGYNSTLLLELYFKLIEGYNKMEEKDIFNINQILVELENLDTLHIRNIKNEVSDKFFDLYNETEPAKIKELLKNIDINDWEDHFKKVDESIDNINKFLKNDIITSSVIDNLYAKNKIREFLNETINKNNKDKELVNSFVIQKDKIEKSISDLIIKDGKSYLLLRNINLQEGKALNTSITINENSLDKTNVKLSTKNEVYKSKMNFLKHDLIYPFVSTGVFYSNTTIRGYGIGSDNSGNLIVVEDDIIKNSPVVGLFLNFQFTQSSRYLTPIVQLGIDPTKKRPFLLAGGGISIPSAKFAITGGAIWTWTPSLTELSVGDKVESTLKLEEDVTYKFNAIDNVGFYIGIQYNFWNE